MTLIFGGFYNPPLYLFFWGGRVLKTNFFKKNSQKTFLRGGPLRPLRHWIYKTCRNRWNFFSHFLHLSLSFQHFWNFFTLRNFFKNRVCPYMHFLENKEMSCVTREKCNWDSNFKGVSSSEAPPYLLLWNFIKEEKIQREHYFCAF